MHITDAVDLDSERPCLTEVLGELVRKTMPFQERDQIPDLATWRGCAYQDRGLICQRFCSWGWLPAKRQPERFCQKWLEPARLPYWSRLPHWGLLSLHGSAYSG